MSRGGKREGAGRKPGSGSGRKVVTASISMLPEDWQRLDVLRGEKSRGQWLTEKVRRAKG